MCFQIVVVKGPHQNPFKALIASASDGEVKITLKLKDDIPHLPQNPKFLVSDDLEAI
jgi:hypothetical protein